MRGAMTKRLLPNAIATTRGETKPRIISVIHAHFHKHANDVADIVSGLLTVVRGE